MCHTVWEKFSKALCHIPAWTISTLHSRNTSLFTQHLLYWLSNATATAAVLVAAAAAAAAVVVVVVVVVVVMALV